MAPVNEQGIRLLPQSDLLQDLRAFLIDCQARRLSPATVARYERSLRHWRGWLEAQGVHQVQAITPTYLRAYLVQLEADGHNPGGQHLAYRNIRRFLRWYEREYEPLNWRNPITKVDAPKVPQEILPPAELADIRAMLATCTGRTVANDRDRAILMCLLDSGARASEFVGLNIGDVDLSTGATTIRHGKGGKDRTVILGAKSRQALARYLRRRRGAGPGEPLWATLQGARLSYWGLRQILRRRAEAASVPCPSRHAFRRAFAILSLRGGMDIETLRRILGHHDLSVIKRYLDQTKDDLREAHERSGPVDNLL